MLYNLILDINIPGGFNAAEFWEEIKLSIEKVYKPLAYKVKIPTSDDPFPLYSYYIVRHQVWDASLKWKIPDACKG